MTAGVVDAMDVLNGDVAIFPQSRSNVVHRIELSGEPIAFIKQRGDASWADGDDAVGNERHVLTLLSELDCVSQLLPLDDREVMWVTPVQGTTLAELTRDPSVLFPVCRAMAHSLAKLHRYGWDTDAILNIESLPMAPMPWPIHAGDLPMSMTSHLCHDECARVIAVTHEPVVRRALERSRLRWNACTWTHGDLSAANIIATPPEPGSSRDVWRGSFIDFESAGIGDPGWDLVTAVATLRNFSIDAALGREAERQFLAEYRRADGPGELSEGLFAVRALVTSWQVAVTAAHDEFASMDDPGGINPLVEELIEIARAHAIAAVHSTGSYDATSK